MCSSDHAPVYSSFSCGVDWKSKSLFDANTMFEKVRKIFQKKIIFVFLNIFMNIECSSNVYFVFAFGFVVERRKCWM
jgi:hypothetical protein